MADTLIATQVNLQKDQKVIIRNDFQIFIKTLTGFTYTIWVCLNHLIAEVKEIISDQANIPTDQ